MSQVYNLICFPYSFLVASFSYVTISWLLKNPSKAWQFFIFIGYGCFFAIVWYYFHPDQDCADKESLWVSMGAAFISWPQMIKYFKGKIKK